MVAHRNWGSRQRSTTYIISMPLQLCTTVSRNTQRPPNTPSITYGWSQHIPGETQVGNSEPLVSPVAVQYYCWWTNQANWESGQGSLNPINYWHLPWNWQTVSKPGICSMIQQATKRLPCWKEHAHDVCRLHSSFLSTVSSQHTQNDKRIILLHMKNNRWSTDVYM